MSEPTGSERTFDDDLDDEHEGRPSGVDEEPDGDLDGDLDAGPEDGQLAYDCAAWAGETRGLLRSLLVTQGIPHAWQGTTLTVRESDEAAVDALIDEVAGTARPALDPDAAKVVYEVGSWPAALQSELVAGLAEADVPYEWDEHGDLVVLEADEELVNGVLEDLPDPDESGISSDDGIAVHELLDRVFMASDRLARNGADASGTVALVDAAEVVEQLALPFGFEPGQWRSFVATVQELRDALDGGPEDAEPPSDEDVAALATRLRELVRAYV